MAPTHTSDLSVSSRTRIQAATTVDPGRLTVLITTLIEAGDIPCPGLLTFDRTGTLTGTFTCIDPAHDLRGVELDDSHELVAIAALGTARGVHDAVVEPAGGATAVEECQTVRIAAVVDRSGTTASRVELLDGRSLLVADDQVSGLVVDAMKRTMRLPTDPVDFGIEPLLSLLWLETLLEVRSAGRPGSTWSEVASLHPAVLVDDDGPFDDLVERCELVAASYDWESIRTLVVAGREPFGLEPRWDDAIEWASWFDASSFARALLAERLPLRRLTDQLAIQMEPDLFHRVLTTVEPFTEALR